jgi:hypothetical protein
MVSSINNYFFTQMWFCENQMDSHNIDEGTGEISMWEESATRCAGEPVSIDAQDSYGSGGGSSRGYATTRCGCALCMGTTLPMSRKRCSVLS